MNTLRIHYVPRGRVSQLLRDHKNKVAAGINPLGSESCKHTSSEYFIF